jgi:hypothetical protein
MRGPKREGHDAYVETACGNDLDAMRAEIRSHMMRGATQTEQFLNKVAPWVELQSAVRQEAV